MVNQIHNNDRVGNKEALDLYTVACYLVKLSNY